MQININTKIIGDINLVPVRKAVQALERDIKNTCKDTTEPGLEIKLVSIAHDAASEVFTIDRNEDNLTITSASSLGLIYGIYHVSREFLGVQNFWFWNEQELTKESEHIVPDNYHYESKPSKVRFR